MSLSSGESNSIVRELGPDEQGNPAYSKPHFPSTPVIKWYQVKMSYEEKARFNLLTYPEYCQWMMELQEENEKASGKDSKEPVKEERRAWDLETTTTTSSNTFWKNDDGKRQNLSGDDYEKFLSENCVDVSNKTNLDISDLIQDIDDYTKERDNKGSVPATENNSLLPEDDPTIQEVLKNVNADIHGESYLTQEEIEALFAAASAAGG